MILSCLFLLQRPQFYLSVKFEMEDGQLNFRFNDRVFTSNYTDQWQKRRIPDITDVRG